MFPSNIASRIHSLSSNFLIPKLTSIRSIVMIAWAPAFVLPPDDHMSYSRQISASFRSARATGPQSLRIRPASLVYLLLDLYWRFRNCSLPKYASIRSLTVVKGLSFTDVGASQAGMGVACGLTEV